MCTACHVRFERSVEILSTNGSGYTLSLLP